MRRPLPSLLIVLFALSSLSAKAEEWKKEFTTSGKPTLRVETNDADIRVTSWDGKQTQARVITEGYKIGPGDVRVTDSQNGDQVQLEVHKPSRACFGVCHQSVSIELQVPHDADLKLHTGDGNIRVLNVKGELHLDSGDGELEIRAADGSLNAGTHDGNIRADGRFGALDLHSGDGNIDAEVSEGSTITSGWFLRTGDGNLRLRIPQNLSADLDAQTGDGRLSVDFPLTVTAAMKEKSIRGKINNGGPVLELRTGDGNIQIEKKITGHSSDLLR